MGASVSNTSNLIKNEVSRNITFEGQKNQCIFNQGGIKLENVKGVNIGLIRITSKCTVTGKTFFNSLVKTLTDLASKLDEDTQAGLGISVSNTYNDVQNKVTSLIQTKCGTSQFITNIGKIEILGAEDSTLAGIIVESEGNVSGECTIDQIIDEISKVVVDQKKKTSGANVAGLLFGSIPEFVYYIIAAVIGIGLIGGIYKYSQKNKNKSGNISQHGDYSEQYGGFFANLLVR